MGRGEKAKDAKEALFKRLYGVKPATFTQMLSILQKEFNAMHKNGGKPPKLTPEGKLYVTLKYLREYRTMGGRYLSKRWHICATGEKSAQEKVSGN